MINCVYIEERNPVLILTGLPSCAGKQGAVSVSRQLLLGVLVKFPDPPWSAPTRRLDASVAFSLVMIMILIWMGTGHKRGITYGS